MKKPMLDMTVREAKELCEKRESCFSSDLPGSKPCPLLNTRFGNCHLQMAPQKYSSRKRVPK